MILVTGGTGVLGSYLLLHLTRKGKKVKVLLREISSKKEVYNLFKLYEPEKYQKLYDSLQWVKGDILDITSLEDAYTDIHQVYHVAEKVSFDGKEKKQMYKVNIEGTKNIINISLVSKIDKLCFISSIATLDPVINQSIITEQSEWNFKVDHSTYACSKYGAEMEVWRGSQEGLNVIVVHPGIILGSGNWNRNNAFLYDMAFSNKAFYKSGTTGFVDASDVAEICIRLMDEKTISNERFILISEIASYIDVMMILRKEFNKVPATKISDFWLKKFAFISRILPFNKYVSTPVFNFLISNSHYSNEKIKKYLSYTFISLEDSLKIHSKNYLQFKNIKNV